MAAFKVFFTSLSPAFPCRAPANGRQGGAENPSTGNVAAAAESLMLSQAYCRPATEYLNTWVRWYHSTWIPEYICTWFQRCSRQNPWCSANHTAEQQLKTWVFEYFSAWISGTLAINYRGVYWTLLKVVSKMIDQPFWSWVFEYFRTWTLDRNTGIHHWWPFDKSRVRVRARWDWSKWPKITKTFQVSCIPM